MVVSLVEPKVVQTVENSAELLAVWWVGLRVVWKAANLAALLAANSVERMGVRMVGNLAV